MEEQKSYRAIFRQKRAEVHTPEEILQAFDSSFCACFALAKDREPGARMRLFGKIWEINPDAIITEVDLFVAQADPAAVDRHYLMINRNGSPESSNLLGRCLEESGAMKEFWLVFSRKRGGIKRCYRYIFASDKSALVRKANLLIDGSDLVLSVRRLSTADYARLKAEENA